MLGLPPSTEVNRRVAKEKLYANADISVSLREIVKEQVEAVFWRNKLATGTFNVGAGESVSELQVFEIQLRQRNIDKRLLSIIAKAIPYKILFILTFEGKAQAWIEAVGTFYNTEWQPADDLVIKFDGLNLDAVYENVVRQIAGERLVKSGDDGDLAKAVENDKKRQKLEREIVVLEKKVAGEKQLNKQVLLNGELKRLRKEREGLNKRC